MFARIKEEIDAVFSRDPAARTRWEVVLCYPGFHAVMCHRLAHKLWRRDWKLLARWLSMFCRMVTGIEIHPGARIGRRLFIDHGMGVVIGETATIGDDVTLYHDVTLGGTSFEKGVRHPQLGHRVIVGAGAQLLGPIQVGDDARIGSNAVVVKDVVPGATMVGVPAHPVKVAAAGGFNAYATPSTDDPMLKTMEQLVREMTVLQKRVAELEGQQQDESQAARRWESNV